jgi:hypothetical protein
MVARYRCPFIRDYARRGFRNFSRNRPETTNLNHQYAIRRVFIVPSSIAGVAPGRLDG